MSILPSVLFCGYKCFPAGNFAALNNIRNVNVIIGKNNCGKSSIIDVIELLCDIEQKNLKYKVNEIESYLNLDESIIKIGFSNSIAGGVPGSNHYEYGKRFIGQDLRVSICADGQWRWKTSDNENDFVIDDAREYWDKCVPSIKTNLKNNTFRRLAAERNITREMASNSWNLSIDGTGATNIIRRFLNLSNMDASLIEVKLLDALNRIMYPEAEFQRIQTLVVNTDSNEDDEWEVFLQEKNTGRFALSQSGSGLKTVILLLLNLLVIPELEDYKKKRIIYAFEELENNLHPALQRRVFDYIYHYALNNDVCIFITTHSHVAINAFFNKTEAQIYHVTKEDSKSTVHKIDNHLDRISILDDLDVKASDLLQSNGIIWVEGPSDRIYIKRWLEIYSNKEFEEGKHYQFLYYGGRLLSHFTAGLSDDEMSKYINILTTNRNAAIIIDSDRKTENARINKTKARIRDEFQQNKMLCWITKGKEIENYIPVEAITNAFGIVRRKQCEPYQLFSAYIKQSGKLYENSKVEFANKMRNYITNENADILDVKDQIFKLINSIEKWNKTT